MPITINTITSLIATITALKRRALLDALDQDYGENECDQNRGQIEVCASGDESGVRAILCRRLRNSRTGPFESNKRQVFVETE